jgi:putative transcriptional regulator
MVFVKYKNEVAIMLKSRLKVLLAEHDTNQRQVANKLGIREATLNAIANNKIKQIPVEVVCKLCEEFNCDIGDIWHYVKDKEE